MTAYDSSSKKRAHIYKFLALLYHDEISRDLMDRLTDKEFLKELRTVARECRFSDMGKGLNQIARGLSKSHGALYKELSYEYADLFLNAGLNPALPYESVHATGEPIVMQASVFDLRAVFGRAGVHKSENVFIYGDVVHLLTCGLFVWSKLTS